MTANRSRGEFKAYRKNVAAQSAQKDVCPFCGISSVDEQFVKETKHFKVFKNIYPYSLWDSQKVEDHLLIVPKMHTDKLGSIGDEAAVEYVGLVDEYESLGYNLYARAPGSRMKSIIHHHSHLIKPEGSSRKFVFYIKKPFIRLHL